MSDSALDQLIRQAMESDPAQFWLNALPWLMEMSGACGGTVLITQAQPLRRESGTISDAARNAIGQWEEALANLRDWFPEGGSLASSDMPPIATANSRVPVVHVTIRQRQVVVGGVSLEFCEPPAINTRLTELVGALVGGVGRLAAMAAENHQLQRRLTRSGLLYELSRTLTSSLDIDVVLQLTAALAVNALGAESSALLLVASEWREFVVAVAHGVAAKSYMHEQLPIDDGIAGWVAQTGLPLIVNQPASEPIFSSLLDQKTGYVTRNALCAPMQARGRILGVLMVVNTEDHRDFGVEDIEWLTALAAQASIAIENARLYSSLRDERDRIVLAEEELRRRLARNLHDSAAQLIGSLLMNIEVARHIATSQPDQISVEFDILRDLVQQVNTAIRQSLLELRPLLLESRGLAGALRGFVNQQRRLGFAVAADIEDLPDIPDRQVETTIYLIVQEALSNVRRHAMASSTLVRAWTDKEQLYVEVEDDGRGIPQEIDSGIDLQPSGMGILSMRERVDWLGGQLLILSPRPGRGQGTLVRVRLSLSRVLAPPGPDAPSPPIILGT